MPQQRPSIFISHPDQAAQFAMQAKEIFERYGYKTWVWKDDRPARGVPDEVMIAAIQGCDYFAYICTEDSAGAPGQLKERMFAKACGKQPFVFLVFDPRFLPDEYPPQVTIYNKVGEETFADDCMGAIERLQRERKLEREANEAEEGEVLHVTDTDTGHGTESLVLNKGVSDESAR